MLKDKVKLALRLKKDIFDLEVEGHIAAAKADLRLAGIVFDDPPEGESGDPLIERAIILFCKAEFGYLDNAPRFRESYLYQKRALCLGGAYRALE